MPSSIMLPGAIALALYCLLCISIGIYKLGYNLLKYWSVVGIHLCVIEFQKKVPII